MSFKYPTVTAGYANCQSQQQSLNSAMMQMLTSEINIPAGMYPQRVPTPGFFDELNHLEGKEYKEKISHINKQVISEAKNNIGVESLNHCLNILLRRGLYKDVLDISVPMVCDSMPLSTRYIIENAKIEEMLVSSKNFNLESYHVLSEDVLLYPENEIRLKLQILNRLLVCSFRYKIPLPPNACAIDYVRTIIDLLNNDHRSCFQSHIDHSVVYRGISMVPTQGRDKQSELLEQAYNHAVAASPSCDYEVLIKNENLFTLLQTLAKWNLFKGNHDISEEYLNDMIELDPYDSTAYSEYGLFLFHQNRFDEALNQFKLASELGPPSVAMNKYFIAQTMKSVNQSADIEPILKNIIEDDPLALSPLLELIEIYKNKSNLEMVNRLVNKVLSSSDLKDQLEENEIVYFTSILS